MKKLLIRFLRRGPHPRISITGNGVIHVRASSLLRVKKVRDLIMAADKK